MKYLIAGLLIAAAVPAANAAQRAPQRMQQTEIACTKLGCVPVPPGCTQTWEQRRDGMPTGYNVIICPR